MYVDRIYFFVHFFSFPLPTEFERIWKEKVFCFAVFLPFGRKFERKGPKKKKNAKKQGEKMKKYENTIQIRMK